MFQAIINFFLRNPQVAEELANPIVVNTVKHVYLDVEQMIKKRNKRAGKHHTELATVGATYPATGSLQQYVTTIYDQGQLGSCTANAFAGGFLILEKVQSKYVGFSPSRLFYYYCERDIEGQTNTDSGADETDGLHFAQTKGVCSETTYPYDITKFSDTPPPNCYVEALKYKISTFTVIPNTSNLMNNIRHCIANNRPVLIAIVLYESFESSEVATTGIVPMPNTVSAQCLSGCSGKDKQIGGHQMTLIGYDDATSMVKVQNSWGDSWGDKGFCYIPYAYLENPDLGIEFTTFSL